MNANEKRVKKKGARLMDRLTNKKEADSQRINYEIRIAGGYPRTIPEERFLLLAAYEDAGLTPEEISDYHAEAIGSREIIKMLQDKTAHLRAQLAEVEADLESSDEANTALHGANEYLHAKLKQVEAQRDKAVADLKEALTANSDETLCKYCKNYFECEGEKCPEFISGVGDAEGKYPTWKWSCMDFDYCAMLENTPCHACHDNAYDGFEWRGTAKEEESK